MSERRNWRNLFGLLGRNKQQAALPAQEELEPVMLRSQEESWLSKLNTDVSESKRIKVVGGHEFWSRVDSLWKKGHERLAAQWVSKFIAMPATPDDVVTGLRTRLVEMHDDRGDLSLAIEHLEALSALDDHAVRSNYLLAEYYRRRGEEALALRHYEAVLARDVDYPNVRVRVERLRAARGQNAPATMGETIAGPDALGVSGGARYRLVRELGRGATGVVYLARDAELERDVAVKLLHPHLAASSRADALARFFDEARVSASLRHPNIVAILDLDERARRIVMELAAGGTLRDVLRDRGPRPIRRALERHTQILSALGVAHVRGIVHRDLKPANLMFRRDPDAPGAEVILGDFGIAHLPDDEGRSPAKGEARRKDAVGTLAYMSPEQRQAKNVEPAWDLYAAAVVLFEMLTGRHPWTRGVLLSGERHDNDFTLPEPVMNKIPQELGYDLQRHLDAIGATISADRPSTQSALEDARTLRDFAIAEALA